MFVYAIMVDSRQAVAHAIKFECGIETTLIIKSALLGLNRLFFELSNKSRKGLYISMPRPGFVGAERLQHGKTEKTGQD